ncbi:MAG: nucleotidyl transferase AbiEii/AbiGii toxin family protein [Albidovulum sp.]|nr:nucleotidyl transferase AbiEii/AbiGii toxin family protein [Albidovulum sp.]
MRLDLQEIVDRAMKDSRLTGMRPVVEKEILHYDILLALKEGGFLDRLVFQGGTALRLCHGGVRFSEDLDFAGGKDFSSSGMAALADYLTGWLIERYGLETSVIPPKVRTDQNTSDLVTAKWRISIMTQPGTPRLPRQRIHLEICNVASHDNEFLPMQGNYDFLPANLKEMTIRVETRKEIFADKLVAFPAALESHPRWRDLWDLQWLSAQQVEADAGLVGKKIEDYRIDDFDSLLGAAVEKIPELVECRDFVDQMGRFLDRNTVGKTVGVEAWRETLARNLRGLFEGLRQELVTGQDADRTNGHCRKGVEAASMADNQEDSGGSFDPF